MPQKSKLKGRYRPGDDLDQVSRDMESPARSHALLYREPDDDLPGAGQFYCVTCARHLTDRQALLEHRRGKPHKRRLRALEEAPYTQAEADAAAGLGAYARPRAKRPVTEPLKPELGLVPPPAATLLSATSSASTDSSGEGEPPPSKVSRLASTDAIRSDTEHL